MQTVNGLLIAIGEAHEAFNQFSIEDKGRKDYYHNILARYTDFGADIGYLQALQDPFSNTKTIVKKDKSSSPPHAYNTLTATLHTISYEIQDPLTEIVDKIYKREYRGDPKLEKHEQDIKNLKQRLSKEDIESKLKKLIKG